jgi:hypothetical protein
MMEAMMIREAVDTSVSTCEVFNRNYNLTFFFYLSRQSEGASGIIDQNWLRK